MAAQLGLDRWENWPWAITLATALTTLSACTAEPQRGTNGDAGERAKSSQQPVKSSEWDSAILAWGSGPRQVALHPAAAELPAQGPSAVAVAFNGETLVLDRWNQRIVSLAPNGDVITRAGVAADAEHLAAGPDGATAAWSPLRATVWIAGRDGTPLGEVTIPRALQDIQRIHLGISHRVLATTALQETLVLGSPRAPLDLASSLRGKREGAAQLADGRGVSARLAEGGGAEIIVYRKPSRDIDEKPPVTWSFPIEAPVSAVLVAGTAGNVICVRIEHVTQQTSLIVEREALCVQADTGHVLVRRALGRPGLYTVHEDLAVGGNPPVVAFIRPEESGLRVERVALQLTTGTRDSKEAAQ